MNDKADMEEQTETKLSKELVFSAIEGDGKSMIKGGDLLWDGEGFEKDEKRALLWYSLAADKGWISDNLLKYYKKEPITIERLEKIEVWLLKGGIGSYEDFVDLIKEHEVDNMNFWLDVAVKYNGGGHIYASGVRLKTNEEINNLLSDLDKRAKEYIEEKNFLN